MLYTGNLQVIRAIYEGKELPSLHPQRTVHASFVPSARQRE